MRGCPRVVGTNYALAGAISFPAECTLGATPKSTRLLAGVG